VENEQKLGPSDHSARKVNAARTRVVQRAAPRKPGLPRLFLAAAALLVVTQPVLPQTQPIVDVTINGEGDNGGVNWSLPATIQLTTSPLGLTYAEWFSAGGFNETGAPLFSSTVDTNAEFYRVSEVSGFPIPSNCRCPCPYLQDQISLGSSFVAIEQESNGFCKAWISACAMGQCSDPTLGLYKWYWQLRYFSGDPSKGLPSSLQIGDIPTDQTWVAIESFTDFSILGTPCAQPPTIITQPQNQLASLGSNAVFTVTAAGTGTLGYQWYFNGAPLSDSAVATGSQTDTLQISDVASNEAGLYYVAVTDSNGSINSAKASLRVGSGPTVISITTKYSPTGNEVLYMLDQVSFPVTFTANVDWGGHSPGYIKFISPEGGTATVAAAGTTATANFDVGFSFGVGGQLQAQALSSDMTASPVLPANLVVMPLPGVSSVLPSYVMHVVDQGASFFYSDATPPTFPFFDAEVSQPVPSFVPLFGGDDFEVKYAPELHITVKGNHANFTAAIGGPSETVESEAVTQRAALIPKLAASADYESEEAGAAWNWSFGLQAEGTFSLTRQFPLPVGVVPVPAFAKLSLSTEIGATLGPHLLPPPPSGAVTGGFTLTGTFGIGVDMELNVAANVSVGAEVDYEFPENTTNYCVFGSASLSAYFFGLAANKPLLQVDYPAGCHASAKLRLSDGFRVPQPYPRDYLVRRSTGRNDAASTGAQPKNIRGVTASAVGTNVFPFSDASIAAAGTNCYAAWVEDNPTRTINNRTMLVFSKFGGITWRTAIPVGNDGTADFHPQLKAFSDGLAAVVWENEGGLLATNASLADFTSNLQIAAAFYEPATGQWQPMQQLSTGAGLHRSPRIDGLAETNLMLIWAANPAGDFEGNNTNVNQLWFATWNGSAWSTPEMFASVPYPLIKYDLSYDGTNAYVVMSLDSDNQYTNVNAHTLYSVSYQSGQWSGLQQLSTDNLANENPQLAFDPSGHVVMVWLDGGDISSAVDFNLANQQTIASNGYSANSGDFKLARGADGRLAVLWAEPSDNPSDLWVMFYDPMHQSWGNAKQLTDDPQTEMSTSATFYGTNQLFALYDRVDIASDSAGITNADFYFLQYQLTEDLALGTNSLEISPANAAPGTAAILSVTAQNLGDNAVSNVPVAFYWGNPSKGGPEIGQTNLVALIPAGGSQGASIPWTIPATTNALEIYAVIDPNHQFPDNNLSNNVVSNTFVEPDLEVQALTWSQITSSLLSATATIVNQGTVPSQPATVSFVLNGVTGSNLLSIEIPGLEPGQTFNVSCPFNVSSQAAFTVYAVIGLGTNAVDLNPQSKALQITIQPNITQLLTPSTNAPPSLATIQNQTVSELVPLVLAASATDTNAAVEPLSFSLDTAPSGMMINSGTGQINWTPSQDQSPSTNSVVVRVTDRGAPPRSATTAFNVVVQEVNVAPELPIVGRQRADELIPFAVTNTAAELNIHSVVSYQLLRAPTGAVINSNGIITWTPSQSLGTNVITTVATASDPYDPVNPVLSATNSFTVIVLPPNIPPVLPAVANLTINELTRMTVSVTAISANPYSTVTYSLLNPPTGAAISPNGTITWTPTQNQSPSTTLFTAVATSTDPYDRVHPILNATNGFYVNVQEVNQAPVLPVIPNQTVKAQTLLAVANIATEANIHDQLTYILANAPLGAAIDANGVITWIPTQAQVGATNPITTVVLAGSPYDLNNPTLSATNSFNVVVQAPLSSYVWTNSQGGDWRIPSNWSPNGVPGPADSVYIPLIGNGPTVMTYVATTIGNLTIGSGGGYQYPVLAGPAPLTVTGPFNWSGGTIQGAVQFSGGALTGVDYLTGGQLINTGTLSWDAAMLFDGSDSLISNAPGGTINLTGNGNVTSSSYAAAFYNAGQLNVTSLPTLSDAFVNTGNVFIQSGIFSLAGGGTNEGTIEAATNAALEFAANTSPFTCTTGSLLTNQGSILFAGYATVNLAGTVSVAGSNIFGADQGNPTVNVTGNYPMTTPLIISGATVNLNGTGTLAPPSLMILQNGTLSNAVPLTTGTLTWSGGNIDGIVQCNGGTLTGVELLLDGGQLINTGTLDWDCEYILDGNNSAISNAPGATINITADSSNPVEGSETVFGIGGAAIYNAGQLNVNVSAGAVPCALGETFYNTGVVTLASGKLIFQNGGTNYGTIEVTDPRAVLEFGGGAEGPFTCASGSLVNNQGNMLFTGYTNIDLEGAMIVEGTNVIGADQGFPTVNVTGYYPILTPLILSNGTANLSGTGALLPSVLSIVEGTLSNTVPLYAGKLNWSGGWIAGGSVQCNGGTMTGQQVYLDGGQLINTGTLAWNVGVLLDGGNSMISNAPGATINMTYSESQSSLLGGTEDILGLPTTVFAQGVATLYNAGAINVSCVSNYIAIDDTLFNTGTISVASGTVALANGGTNEGVINVAPKATLAMALYPLYVGPFEEIATYPVMTFGQGSIVNVSGSFQVGGIFPDGTVLTIMGEGAYLLNLGGVISVAGSNIFGAGETYPTTVNMTAYYSTAGPLIFSGNAALNLSGPGLAPLPSMTMNGGTLSNTTPVVINGPLNWSGGTIAGSVQFNGGTLSNSCDLQGGQLINTGTLAWNSAKIYDGAGSVISNAPGGTINLNVGTGPVTSLQFGGASTFDNAGQLNFFAGPNTSAIGDTFNNTGTVSVSSGTLSLTAVYRQTAGLTSLSGGGINNSLPLQIQGGTLGGVGAVEGSITNSGVLIPGNPLGQLAIGGSYFQTPAGSLNIAVAGTTPGAGFSLLNISGAASLAGTLNAVLTNNYHPANTNASFAFLGAASIAGTFSNFIYPFDKVGMQVNYAPDSASIQVTSVGPVLQEVAISAPKFIGGQFSLEVGGSSSASYIIQGSTDLLHWLPLATNSSPANTYNFMDPFADTFPARFYRVQIPAP
jgi:hypothetical protein